MNYLHWDQKTIDDFSDQNIEKLYSEGFVFTRLGRGVIQQTRSARINLEKFQPTSENRRILKKVSDLTLELSGLPLKEYDWNIGKLAKDFYDSKFGPGIMSAQKIKEMLTDAALSNFNTLFLYTHLGHVSRGYTICYKNPLLLHYSYPFYDLDTSPKDMGLGMMTMAIEYAKKAGMKYIYLGSLQRPADTYKLQFQGLEWFDGKNWQTDFEAVKGLLKTSR